MEKYAGVPVCVDDGAGRKGYAPRKLALQCGIFLCSFLILTVR